ncbi:hypothetical protein ABK040_001889 [Willaertia magna]
MLKNLRFLGLSHLHHHQKKNPLIFIHQKTKIMSYSTQQVNILDKQQVKEILNNKTADKDFILIDVREPAELKDLPKINESAHNIPLNDVGPAFLTLDDKRFKSQYGFDKPSVDTQIICYCKLGGRAQKACDTLVEIGYKNVHNYKGSANDWHNN